MITKDIQFTTYIVLNYYNFKYLSTNQTFLIVSVNYTKLSNVYCSNETDRVNLISKKLQLTTHTQTQ